MVTDFYLSLHGLNRIGLRNELTDKINRMLNMFDPVIFPTAISVFLFVAAIMDVANSGKYLLVCLLFHCLNLRVKL